MATTYNLAPIPRWQFTDDSGTYNIYGKLYTFRSIDHNEPKAVYQDIAGSIPYTNPIILDGIGSIGPIYWASDENYYIELRDSSGTQLIWSVDNFNAPTEGGVGDTTIEMDYKNYILNGQFDVFNLNATSKLIVDGDSPCYLWSFKKDGSGATDQFSLIEFSSSPFSSDTIESNPRYYLQHDCTAAGTLEHYKEYRHRLGHVSMFANEAITFSIWARGMSGSQYLKIYAYQNFGTGGSEEVATLLTNDQPNSRFDLTEEWVKYSVSVVIPSIHGMAIGTDDYFEIGIQVPLNLTSSIGFTNVQWNRGEHTTPLEYEVVNPYELRATIFGELCAGASPISNWDNKPTSFSSNNILFNQQGKVPKLTYSTTTNQLNMEWGHDIPVGSVMPWLTSSIPNGWLLCDGRTASSTEYYDLYTLLGQTYGRGNGMVGVSKTSDTILISNVFPGSCTVPTDIDTGFTFVVSTPGSDQGTDVKVAIGTNIDQYALHQCIDGIYVAADDRVLLYGQTNQKQNGIYKANSVGQIVTRTSETGADVALHSFYVTHGFVNANRSFYCTNTSIVFGTTNIAFDQVSGVPQVLTITCKAASTFDNGASFLVPMFDGTTIWQVIMIKDGVFDFTPSVSATNFAYAYVSSDDDSSEVATAVYTALNPSSFSLPPLCGTFLRGVDHGTGIDVNAATRLDRGDGTTGDNVGTRQMDDALTHTHSYRSGYNSTGGIITAFDDLTQAGENYTSYELKDNTTTDMVGAGSGYENLVRNVSVNWIIKYK